MRRIVSFFLCVILLLPLTYATAKSPEIRGVWVGTVANLDFPSQKGLSATKLKSEIDDIIANCKLNNINTVFFQVRPNSDALYKSDVFPWSEVLSGTQGIAPDLNFDPLEYIIEKAHSSDISLHAWINPYRIGDYSALCDRNPAKLHPEYVVHCWDGKAYYNPALPEVRELVANGVLEIIQNYNVDGIHFDDYFYPYDVEDFPDAEAFEKYGEKFDDIADFRRNNVNLLVKKVSELVHKYKKSLKFGISPFGIWDNKRDNPLGSETTGMSSYSQIYADSRYWVKQNLVDYICPQIYWSFENPDAPFDKVLSWWNSLCKNSKTELYAGIALYKRGTEEAGWKDETQIQRQIALCESASAVRGIVYFRYSSLLETYESKTEYLPTVPAISDKVKITGPVNNYKTEKSYCSVTGMSDPNRSLIVNGSEVELTEHGYFSVHLPLEFGNNTFTFSDGESSDSVTIKRIVSGTSDDVSIIKNVFPYGESKFFAGERIDLTVYADDGCEVFAIVNGNQLKMDRTDEDNYRVSIEMPDSSSDMDFQNLKVEFKAIKDGKTYFAEKSADIKVITSPIALCTAEQSYVYDSYLGGSMMDNYQYPKGVTIYANACVDDMYRLVTGKWINKTDVSEMLCEEYPDFDTSKYIKTAFSFEKDCTYYCDTTENGKLEIDFYHQPGDAPKIKEVPGIVVRSIKSATRTKVLVSLRTEPVTGFFMTKSEESNVELWIYKNRSDGIFGKTVVIDAGHGGEDSGALGPAGSDGPTESDLNLSISLLLKQKLEKAGAMVYLTRSEDETLLLKERAEIIRSYNPDMCISLHHNSVERETDFNTASGVLTLYSREVSKPLADAVSRNATLGIQIENDGAKMQSLNVCREYAFPCILVECGFVCNPSEYELLLTDAYKNSLLDNIVLTITDYFR